MSELETTVKEISTAFGELKKQLDRSEAESKKYGEATTETKGAIEKLQATIDELEKKHKALETRLNRPDVRPEDEKKERDDFAGKAFDRYARKGMNALTPDELKAIATDQETEGGVFMPLNRSAGVVEYLREIDEVRQIANVVSISQGDSWSAVLENSDAAGYGWTTERGTRSESTTPGFKERTIFCHEMYAFPYITQKSIDDLAFNVESWLQGRIGNRFAQIEGAAFVEGTGSGQPFGLLTRIGTGTDTIGYVAGGHATLLKADALIELVDDMPRRYQANGSFLMHRSTRRLIRQLKDGAGNYLWERSIQGGQPSTLLGFPIYEATNMDAPSSGAYTTNQYAALFGDFRAAYTIVDRQGIRVLRDPYSAKPYIGYYVTYRVGGDVVDTAAIKALKIATS